MKAAAIVLALSCLAFSAFADARVDLTAVIGKDFIASPSLDQAAQALEAELPFVGFGWEVLLGHVGLGGSYAVDFHKDAPSSWWLDWEGQAIYASYHILGSRSFIDPFVDAGLGCAGRIYLGPSGSPGESLALTIYPFVSAGAALELNGLRVGAKLSYALSQSAIPVTDIPEYPLGRFQVSAFAGISIGGR
jgi:hypothetical protein